MRKVPLHFSFNYCYWFVLPNVKVIFEIITKVLVARQIDHDSVGFYASAKGCAKATQLNVIRENN